MRDKILPAKGEIEIWIDIPNYEGLYQASSFGRFKSYPKSFKLHHGGICKTPSKILKFTKRNGYLLIILRKNNKRETFSAHRIIASLFTPNPFAKPQVNHKDGYRTNNYFRNLEWNTPSENVEHSYLVLKRKSSKKSGDPSKIQATQKDLTGKIIQTYPSITHAERVTGITRHHIGMCIQGKRKTAGGYLWT